MGINNIDLWHIFLTHWNWLYLILLGGPITVYVRSQ